MVFCTVLREYCVRTCSTHSSLQGRNLMIPPASWAWGASYARGPGTALLVL